MKLKPGCFARSLLTVAIGATVASWSQAQENASGAQGLEEIIVTAERRETSLQDTPISVLAFGSADLEKFGIDDLGDIQHSVPNLYMRQFPNSQASLRTYMRGVGNNDVGMSTDPSVGVYIDGVYVARSIGLGSEVASLERIEVLRGPQGSLYGRNTIGGAINMVTAKPTGEFGFKGGLSAGDSSYGRGRVELDTPRVGGLAAKVSMLKSKKDGWVNNQGSGPNFGDNDSFASRVALNWQPTDDVNVDYAYDMTDADSGTIYYQTLEAPLFGFSQVPYQKDRLDDVRPSTPVQESNVKIKGHALTVAWDISENTQIKSITGYRELDQSIYQDYSANRFTTRLYANAPFDNQQDQFSQELQVLGKFLDGAVDYVVGAYYFKEKGDEDSVDYITLPLGFLPPYPPIYDQLLEIELPHRVSSAENEARAFYGHFVWTPAAMQQLHLTLGLRYSEDDRAVKSSSSSGGYEYFTSDVDDSWDNHSIDVTAAYDITDDVNVYAKFTQGYKTGGFNIRATSDYAASLPLSEETVETIEVGIKAQFLDDRVRLNAAVFSSDYQDIQLSFAVLNDPTNVALYNAGAAKIKGAEIDLTTLITDSLKLTLGYGLLDTSVDDVDNPQTPEIEKNPAVLPGAPDNSFTADLDYTFPSFGLGELMLNVNYSKVDEAEFVSFVQRGFNIPGYDLWNARLSLGELSMGHGTASIALWGKNLGDEEYLLDGIESFPWSPLVAPFGEGRTWGVDFNYEY